MTHAQSAPLFLLSGCERKQTLTCHLTNRQLLEPSAKPPLFPHCTYKSTGTIQREWVVKTHLLQNNTRTSRVVMEFLLPPHQQ